MLPWNRASGDSWFCTLFSLCPSFAWLRGAWGCGQEHEGNWRNMGKHCQTQKHRVRKCSQVWTKASGNFDIKCTFSVRSVLNGHLDPQFGCSFVNEKMKTECPGGKESQAVAPRLHYDFRAWVLLLSWDHYSSTKRIKKFYFTTALMYKYIDIIY